jgi:hypothetical protein
MLNETQIGDVWLLFADFIDKKNHEAIAERYVDLLADFGVPDKVLSASSGVDSTLDAAIDYYLDEEDAGEEDDDYKELEF